MVRMVRVTSFRIPAQTFVMQYELINDFHGFNERRCYEYKFMRQKRITGSFPVSAIKCSVTHAMLPSLTY